jgi:sugar lactone lactonase YvrE
MALTTLVSGLSFGEGPRWRDGHLYYSDFYQHQVNRVDEEGSVDLVAEVPTQPSGLGWLPDDRLLIVSMTDRKLLRLEADGTLQEHADLSSVAAWHCNDMVVDASGRAYVGNFGFDNTRREEDAKPVAADLAMVDVDGSVSCAAQGFKFPNGSVITPDGSTLIVAETMGRVLSAFDIGEGGTLSGRRVWANVHPHFPDGICLDADGAIWIADPVGNALVRIVEGGEVKQTISLAYPAYACMLGGDDGRRLFACTGLASGAKAAETTDAKIEFVDVEVPHAGLP